MKQEKIEVNGKVMYYDPNFSKDNTGVAIHDTEDPLEQTQEIEVISEKDLLEDTNTDIFGEENE